MLLLYIAIFLISGLALFWSGARLVDALVRVSRFLGWREFVVAFFIMAFAGSLPNLFVGINAALRDIPQLSFGDIVGGNVVDLTLAVALAILIGGTALPARSRVVQRSAFFTSIVAVLPLVLILDGVLGRGDGLVLLGAFAVYLIWLFSKEERFKKKYTPNKHRNSHAEKAKKAHHFSAFLRELGMIAVSVLVLLAAAEGIVRSAQNFSLMLGISLPVIGMLVVGVGNALPETYFAILSARKKHTWMILGDLMGSVIVCATFVLGVVALLAPIHIGDFSPFAIARIFLIVSAFFFWFAVRSDNKITRKEGVVLLLLYIAFLAAEIITKTWW